MGGQVCSVSLLAGLLILLRSATKITHKAQAVTCLAAKWHVCATVDSFDTVEAETTAGRRGDDREQFFSGSSDGSSDVDDVGDEEDEMDNSNFVPSYAYSTISFQKRQALGKIMPVFKYPTFVGENDMSLPLRSQFFKFGLISTISFKKR